MACLTYQESTLCKKGKKKVAKVPTHTRIDKDSASFNFVFSLNHEAEEGKTWKSTTEGLFNVEFYLMSILHNKIQEVCICNLAKNNDPFL
jgi:hypothetical protein